MSASDLRFVVSGHVLFVARDASTAWAWLPVGHEHDAPVEEILTLAAGALPGGVRMALGSPAGGVAGFQRSHVEAQRAFAVATVDEGATHSVTSYADEGVRAAALLSRDLEVSCDLVLGALGGLAEVSDQAEHLRHTLAVFLAENGSYVAAADRLHVHKNTVKYRVDKAVALRGRPIDEGRLDLELALHGCQWLGSALLDR